MYCILFIVLNCYISSSSVRKRVSFWLCKQVTKCCCITSCLSFKTEGLISNANTMNAAKVNEPLSAPPDYFWNGLVFIVILDPPLNKAFCLLVYWTTYRPNHRYLATLYFTSNITGHNPVVPTVMNDLHAILIILLHPLYCNNVDCDSWIFENCCFIIPSAFYRNIC